MNDEEIIKVLECCTEDEDCSHCPSIKEMPYCSNDIMVGALNLIKRQQMEIERLKNEIQITKDAYTMLQTKNEIIKFEAIKEFAERLKEKSFQSFGNYGITRDVVEVSDIDNLVKEMESDDNA